MILMPLRCCCCVLLLLLAPFAFGRRTRDLKKVGVGRSVEVELTSEAHMPRFAESIPNITVTIGKEAVLACVVDNLKNYKVAWVRVDTQTILSIHHNVITQNPRISLSHSDHRSWYLYINDVQESDRGWYMCQINTDPMRSRVGYVQVVVPPSILDKETSTDMVIREGSNVSMNCKAEGYPEPNIMWRREDGKEISYNGNEVSVVDGDLMYIMRVSRLHMGAYLCIASNGVPPSISKRVLLRVQFPPMLSIPNQLEGAYTGQDVVLECHTEAYPTSINYWTTEKGDMIVSGDKYEAVSTDDGYKKFMMLKIRNVATKDFGSYKCVAKNSLGETDGLIKLDEIPVPSTTSTSSTTSTPPGGKKRGRKHWKQRHKPNEVVGTTNKDYTTNRWDRGEMSSWDEANGLEESPEIPSEGLAMGDSATWVCSSSVLLVASSLLTVLGTSV